MDRQDRKTMQRIEKRLAAVERELDGAVARLPAGGGGGGDAFHVEATTKAGLPDSNDAVFGYATNTDRGYHRENGVWVSFTHLEV